MALKKFYVRLLTEEQFADPSKPRRGRWHAVMAKSKPDAANKFIDKRIAEKRKR